MIPLRHPCGVELDTWEGMRNGGKRRRFRRLSSVHAFPDFVFPFQFLQSGAFSAGGPVTDAGAARKMEGKLSKVSRLGYELALQDRSLPLRPIVTSECMPPPTA
jgi:hypothetical protein